MSSLRPSVIVIMVVAGLFAAGCDKKPADQAGKDATKEVSKVVATVNSDSITESDYKGYLQLRQQQMGPLPDKDKEKKIVLDDFSSRDARNRRRCLKPLRSGAKPEDLRQCETLDWFGPG